MNIFEQYGIKEVADVCLYSIELDENDDEIYVPVLYLDTLKVSTIEETAEQTSARGGLGNPELIIWDYGKEITVNLEDALYSPASQGMTWGGKYGTKHLTLRGMFTTTIKIQNEDTIEEKIDYECPVSIIIKDFNNFTEHKEDSTNRDPNILSHYYSWIVRANIITDDNQINVMIEDCPIYYDIVGNKWTVSNATLGDNAEIIMGDVNLDGSVNVSDIVKLNMHLLDKEKNPLGATEEEKEKAFIAADVVQDGVLNSYDSSLINNYVAMMVTKEELGIASLFKGKNVYISINEDNPYPPQEAIYQINHSLQNVHFLDRMEKCIATQTFCIDTAVNTKHGNYRYLQKYSQCELTVFIDPRTMQPYESNTDEFIRKNGKKVTGQLRIIKQHEIYYKWTRSKAIDNTSLGHQIIVDAIHFPGTYRLVGETYSRSRKTGKDQRYQFEIPLCKMGSENNLTLQADGDPTTFNMTLKVLRREDGVMMKLTQFDVTPKKYDNYISDSTVVIPGDEIISENFS